VFSKTAVYRPNLTYRNINLLFITKKGIEMEAKVKDKMAFYIVEIIIKHSVTKMVITLSL